jgi:hypothetical protein
VSHEGAWTRRGQDRELGIYLRMSAHWPSGYMAPGKLTEGSCDKSLSHRDVVLSVAVLPCTGFNKA